MYKNALLITHIPLTIKDIIINEIFLQLVWQLRVKVVFLQGFL